MNENDFNILTIIILFIVIVGSLIFLTHNAKINCEKFGGFLVSKMIGKSYRLECVR
jgi:hypothetical protein